MDDGLRQKLIQFRSVQALCALRKWGDHFDYAVDENRYIRLRVRGKVDQKYLAIQFPRSPAMTPHYKAIRDWFARHNVEWKDKTHDGARYMSAKLPQDAEWAAGLLEEAGQMVFGVTELLLVNRTPLLYVEHVLARRPRLWIVSLILLFLVLLGFWGYEFSGAMSLTLPSLSNVSRAEIICAGFQLALMLVVRSLLHRPVLNVRAQNMVRAIWSRIFVFAPMLIAFLTA